VPTNKEKSEHKCMINKDTDERTSKPFFSYGVEEKNFYKVELGAGI
jgi:hypothetical protein